MIDTTTGARFWAKVAIAGSNDCWEWKACRNGSGYGSFGLAGGRAVGAHRFAYELLVGPIPDGLQIDHLCRNKGCVNPAHLEAVTIAENHRRSRAWGHDHCPRGHAYDESNTYHWRGHRFCRTCNNAATRLRRGYA